MAPFTNFTVKFESTNPLISFDLRPFIDSQRTLIAASTDLPILKKTSRSISGKDVDEYVLSDNESRLLVFSESITLDGPIDLLPTTEAFLQLAKSLSREISFVCYSLSNSTCGDTQPEPHRRRFRKEVTYLNRYFGHLEAEVHRDSESNEYLAYGSGMKIPYSVVGSGGVTVKPDQACTPSAIVDEEAANVIGSGGLKFKSIKRGSGMKDSRNLRDMIVVKIDKNDFYVLNDMINKSLSENHRFEVNNGKCYSVNRNIDGIPTGNGCRATGYVKADADDDGCPFLCNGGNVSNASSLVLAGFRVNWNVTCADNGAFHNTGILNVGMNNGDDGNRFRMSGINAGQNGHPSYNGNGNGGGNVPNGGSDMLPGDDVDNYISIMRRSDASNGEPCLTVVGHVVLPNPGDFPLFSREVHLEWARYENQMPHEDGEIDASTAWPGYKTQYLGTVEGYETDGMVELEVPGWGWEVFADRLEEIIVEREDEDAEENVEDEEA